MLRGKCEGNGVSKDIELIPLKNRNEQKQNKNTEKGTKRSGESKEKCKEKKMKRRIKKMILHVMKKNDLWSDHPEI